MYFVSEHLPHGGLGGVPATLVELPFTWKRTLAVAAVTALVAVLHGLLFLWYVNRPEPLPFTEARPLPTIDMVLSAPPSPAAAVQPNVPPPPSPPKETKKPDPKPVKKTQPKPMRKEPAVKRAEPQKQEQAQTDTAPPAPAAPSAPSQDRAAAARSDSYTPASSNADYLHNPKPVYPGVARRRHWEGLVVLRVYVAADGHCGEVQVQRSSGHDVLDEAALDAVKKWRFVPAKRGDVAQASWATVPIEFRLE